MNARNQTLPIAAVSLCALFIAGLGWLLAASPAARAAAPTVLSFTDITVSAGTGGPTGSGQTGGHGVMWADVDDDGRPDLYITMNWNNPMAELFFRNTNGAIFSDEGAARGIDDYDGGSHGACFADLDNDGDYDLYNGTTTGVSGNPANNDLFRNDGLGYFTDVTAASGMPVRDWPTRAVNCFDMDGDGDLDLFGVTNYRGSGDPASERNEVYRNDGNLQFTAVNSGDLYTAPAGQAAIDTDFDGDGDIDIIAANRTGDLNILQNDGAGNFSLIAPATLSITHAAGDGISAGDVDNDGDLDLLLASENVGYLYLRSGAGTYTLQQSFSATDGYMGGLADLDNDGDMDLVFAGDNISYLNDGAGNFSVGPVVPIGGINDPRAVAFADIDDDGDLDFAIGAKRTRNWLVRNNFDAGNWLKIELIDAYGQAGAFGAKVFVYPAGNIGGTLVGMREARSNTGYLAQDEPVLHFGLGGHSQVGVRVAFLDGTTVEQDFVSAGQTILVAGGSPDPISILPLGDSITQADNNAGQNSYRRPLWQMLETAGYNVDFVGSLNTNYNGGPPNPDFDLDHEGHWGWYANEIINGKPGEGKLTDWLAGYTPDIVLLHLGHNDLKEPGDDNTVIQNTLNEIGQIIDILRADNPDVIILLAQLIPSSKQPRDVRIPLFNAEIPNFAAGKTQPSSPVIVVDHYTGFSVVDDTYDGTHPDDSGEQKMSQVWYDALTPLLAPMATAVNIAHSGGDVVLNWTDHPNNSGGYDVYRHTVAYFDGATPGATLVTTLPAGTTAFTDTGKIGDVTMNYFYLVTAHNSAGQTADSNLIGEFDFALTPGN